MPLIILLQCSYVTKELELKNNLNMWLSIVFILWKKSFSVALCFPSILYAFGLLQYPELVFS